MYYIYVLQDFYYYAKTMQFSGMWHIISNNYLFFAIIIAVIAFILLYLYFEMTKGNNTTSHGGARFANLKEVSKRLYNNEDVGIICGKFKNKICAITNKHLMLCAPTGSGKGVGVVIPTLLKYTGSMIVNDPKGQCYYITKRAREEMGQKVYLLAPYGHKFKHLGQSSCFNPLDLIDLSNEDAENQIKLMASTLIVSGPHNENDFWILSPRRIVSVIIYYVCHSLKGEERTLAKVRDILTLETTDFINIVKEIQQIDSAFARNGANAIISAWAEGEGAKMISSLFETINAHTSFLDDNRVRHFFSKSDFNLDMLLYDNISIYFVFSKGAETIAALLFDAAFYFIRNGSKRTEKLKRNEENVLFLIDEFPQINYMPTFEKEIGIIREYGGTLMLVIQDISQLKKTYKDGWSTFFTNAASMFIGAQDITTAKLISETLGNITVFSKSKDSKGNISYSETAKPLRTTDELISGGNKNTILFAGNESSGEGMHATLLTPILYYKDKNFKDDADPNPYR